MPDATAEQPTLISPVRGHPFTAGNAGRKLGSKNRVTVIASSLLEGETEALVRKAVELAKAGDRDMLKFLLGRVLPRERTIKFDMPTMEFGDDGVAALGSIMRAVAAAEITPDEGAKLATIVNSYTAAIDVADVAKRMDALEAQIKGSGP
jgi:tripartite-type tricarboxylate transporter receptor subunit TctC